jgi:hypothetical protein
MNKEVMMYAAIALDKIVNGYLDFIATKREFLSDKMIKASCIEDETYEAISAAVVRTLHIMKNVEELGTGDATGHRLWQKRLAEIKSIMHIARSHPSAAIARLKALPSKKLMNA